MKMLTENQVDKYLHAAMLLGDFRLICGKEIGHGAHRDVFEFKFDPEHYVVKIERKMSDLLFANVMEWRNFIDYQDTPLGKWLCPVVALTEDGRLLIMRRAEYKSKISDYPKQLPPAFTDHKIQNYGFVDGRCVATDYSFMLHDQGKPKNVKWRKS